MRNQKEIAKIGQFLAGTLPIVVKIVKTFLQSSGWQVKQEGQGLDLVFSIKSGEKETKFFLHNLLLEIATIDRDKEPLRFDEKLRDFDFFLAKTTTLIQSKLKILSHLFAEDDVEAAVKNISQDAKHYERIRIWRFNQNTPS